MKTHNYHNQTTGRLLESATEQLLEIIERYGTEEENAKRTATYVKFLKTQQNYPHMTHIIRPMHSKQILSRSKKWEQITVSLVIKLHVNMKKFFGRKMLVKFIQP